MRQAALLFAIPLLTVAAGLAPSFHLRAAQDDGSIAADAIIVQFADGTTLAEVGAALDTANAVPAESTTLPGAAIVTLEPGQSTGDAIAALEADDSVLFAEPDYPVTATITPNDSYMGSNCQVSGGPLLSPCQWGPAYMSAPGAWDTTTGDASVVVAVIDTGVQTNHPDLSGKLVAGYNTIAENTNVTDDNGHGTHVSGTIGATTNNGAGVAGICWLCKVMPVKALDSSGGGTSVDIAEAINWAVANGAEVINMSLGINLPGCPTSSAIDTAVDNAWAAGVIVVAASGNNADNADPTDDCVFFPASHPNAIAVGAYDDTGTRASFSNYGPELDVTAPGDYIMSTIMGSGYGLYSGTSMATPHVAGLVGLLISNGITDKNTIVSQITSTATDAGAAGFDDYYGNGRVNAALAVVPPDTTPPTVNITAPTNGATVSGLVTIDATAADASGIQQVEFSVGATSLGFDASAPFSVNWDTNGLPGGSYALTATAYDSQSNSAAHTIDVTLSVPDTTAPAVNLSSPAAGGVSGTISIDATASDNVGVQKVQFWAGATYLGYDTTAPYSKSWDTTAVPNGSRVIRARAVDLAGNTAERTVTVFVTNGDSTPPTVSIASPANGANVSGTVAINATAGDATGVQKVQFWAGATYLGYDTTAPYSKSWNTSALPDGAYVLRARALDWSNNYAEATITVTKGSDVTPPTVSMSTPSDLEVVSGTVAIDATASDNTGVAKVRLWIDGAYVGYDATAPYGWIWDTSALANGSHTIRVQSIDLSGNVSSSVTITVTVAN